MYLAGHKKPRHPSVVLGVGPDEESIPLSNRPGLVGFGIDLKRLLSVEDAQPVEVSEGCCDFAGCDMDAVLLVPGCFMCEEHASACGALGGATYRINADDLTGGAEWRTARKEQYIDLLRELRDQHPDTARRTPERDEALDLLIRRRTRGMCAAIERGLLS